MPIIREASLIPLDEDAAASVVQELVDQAVRDMLLLVQDYLLKHGTVDGLRRHLSSLVWDLERLAAQYGLASIRGRWGAMLEAAMLDGSEAAAAFIQANGGEVPHVAIRAATSRATVDAALFARRMQIKNVLEQGALLVGRLVADAIVRRRPLAELSQDIWAQLSINGKGIPRWRAELIARNELFAAYRQASKVTADASGLTHFIMTGPVDESTSAICLQHVGMVLTAEQWEAVERNVFIYGLHIGCRHGWDPARVASSTVIEMSRLLRDRADAEVQRRLLEREAMKSARAA